MEIEAKFAVPNFTVARKLRALTHMNEFSLSPPTRFTVRDTFFDTRGNDLLNTRHVLRVRQRSDGRAFLTFKAPVQKLVPSVVEGTAAIHRRPETEVEISQLRTPRVLRVNELPIQIKKLVAPLVNDESLFPMFSISQTREVRNVRHARRIIAELSLDHVKFRAGKRQHAFYELEIELKKAGKEIELEKIADWLEKEFGLSAEHKSKFVRAVEFMRAA